MLFETQSLTMYKLRCMFEPKVPLQDFSEKVQQTGPEPSTQSKITSSLQKKKKVPLHPITGDMSKTQSGISKESFVHPCLLQPHSQQPWDGSNTDVLQQMNGFKKIWHMCGSRSVVSDSLWPHGLQPARLLSVEPILQARILKWIAMPFSKGSSRYRNRT